MDKMKVVVLGAKRYSFADEKTGREIEGCKVHYVSLDPENEQDSKGLMPKAETMDYAYYKELSTFPGVYEASLKFEMSGKGIRVKITDFKFIEPVTFELPVKA